MREKGRKDEKVNRSQCEQAGLWTDFLVCFVLWVGELESLSQ